MWMNKKESILNLKRGILTNQETEDPTKKGKKRKIRRKKRKRRWMIIVQFLLMKLILHLMTRQIRKKINRLI